MKILLPLDDSPYAKAAVDFIASRTTLIGAEPQVLVLNVQPPLPARAARTLGAKVVRSYHVAESNRVLKPALAALKRAGLDATALAMIGKASETIAAIADRDEVDLIVMGSHGHGAIAGLIVGSCTSGVMARSRKPIVLLRGRYRAADALNVGIALDGSRYGKAAARYVARHRELFGAGARFTLINVVPDFAGAVMPDMTGLAMPAFSEEDIRAMRKHAFEHAVAPVRTQLAKAGIEAAETCLTGNPGEAIADYARKAKLDLLILGSHGLGAFKRALLGSVATRVAAHCHTPLLLIRAP
jgi:nucleotide-binding universal stress UspA family protein